MAQRVVIPGFRKIETSSSGEGGTTNYEDLTNKPSINNVPLVGNLNTADLKLTDATLTEEGVPAEAKTVGAKLEEQSTSLTALSEQLGNHTVKSDVPENAVFTDTVYDDTEIQKRISDNGYGEVAGGKNLANFSKLGAKTTNGITFEYQSNGSIKVSGTVLNKDDNVYTPLNLTKTRFSKGHWYTASVKSSNPKSIAKLFFTDKGSSTTFQASETADVYYYIQFFDGAEGKIPAGTIIDEVLYPQIEEGKVVTEYEPYFPSNKMLARDVADLRGDVDGFGDEFVTRRIQLLNNRTADYYRYIEPIPGRDQILTPPIIVNGTATSFDSSGGDEVSGANYSYAPRESVKMDILDVEVSSSVTQEGITVKFLDKRLDLSKLYNVTGKATSDIEIPLYSVTNPKNDYLYFITDSVSKMSSDTFYIKISDSSGNETTLGTDGSKSLKTYLKKHNGKVTVYLVVKSGITVKQYVNVKCGYSSSDCIADFSPKKYSDTIDNVLDAIFDLNSRLKALENK